MRTLLTPLFLLLLAGLGCQEKPAPAELTQPSVAAPATHALDPALAQASLDVWALGLNTLDAAKTELVALRESVQKLLQEPTQASLLAARDQWHIAHNHIQNFSLFFAMASAHPGLFVQLDSLHNQLDGWPIQPGFLDYFDVYTHSGLVNDIAFPITAKALKQANQQFDPMDRALGLHPIAYLLWGENGKRPFADFVKQHAKANSEDQPSIEDLTNNRRRALLALMLELAIDDVDKLHAQWQDSGAFTSVFTELSPQQRSEILRTSSLYLIEQLLIKQQLQPQLDALSQPDFELTTHNLYSGGNAKLLTAQLNSLSHLSTPEGTSLLIEHWSRGANKSWQVQLKAVNRVLDKLPREGSATETNWVAAIAALQQLALPLKAQVEAD